MEAETHVACLSLLPSTLLEKTSNYISLLDYYLGVPVWRGEGHSQKYVLLLHHMGPGDQTQVDRFSGL